MQLIIKHVDLGADGEANHPKDQEEWIFHQLCKGVEPLEILIFDEHDVPVVFPGFRALFFYIRGLVSPIHNVYFETLNIGAGALFHRNCTTSLPADGTRHIYQVGSGLIRSASTNKTPGRKATESS